MMDQPQGTMKSQACAATGAHADMKLRSCWSRSAGVGGKSQSSTCEHQWGLSLPIKTGNAAAMRSTQLQSVLPLGVQVSFFELLLFWKLP